MNRLAPIQNGAHFNAHPVAGGRRVVRRGQTQGGVGFTADAVPSARAASGANRCTNGFFRGRTNLPRPRRELARIYFPQ
jgi:hypothetical protein